jgi:magnesium transporter
MTTDYAWLPAHVTVEEALDRLRLQAPDKETIYYVYVVDDQRRLIGVVSLRDLILAARRAVVRDIMETQVLSARVTYDREQVAQFFTRYDLLALPVVDADDRLVGIITHDDVMDVVVSEATEDAQRMGGVAPFEEDYLEASFFLIWRKRAVWLAMLFVAELATFTALTFFEDAIAEVVVLSLFVPLCISTGGNSGAQAATLITRAMALGQVTVRDWVRVFRHEIVMGLALGATLGIIGFVRASWTSADVRASAPPRPDAFIVTTDTELQTERHVQTSWFGPSTVKVKVILPPSARQVIQAGHSHTVELPDNVELDEPVRDSDGRLVYTFPKRCTMPRPPVPLWQLAQVIALSVAAICLMGTLIGALLPIVFQRFGIDPGIASSPFVATFVDVTGIVVYFLIARWLLYPLVP